MTIIHPTAIVSKHAKIATNVSIGPYTVINANVEIGSNSIIGAFCEIGILNDLSKENRLTIGANSNIRSHSILYSGSNFGDRLETGHHVTLRENITTGSNLRVGSYSDLQGDMEIGNYVRIHSNVHLCKFTKIGNYVFIYQFSITTSDFTPPSETIHPCVINDFAIISVSSVILPGVNIGKHALVGANSTVTKDVEEYALVFGSPARKIKDVREIRLHSESKEIAYPWNLHFRRGFPQEVIENWNQN